MREDGLLRVPREAGHESTGDDHGRVGFLDWGVINVTTPIRDAGYFINMAMQVEERRAHEEELLRHYEQTLMEEFGGRLHWGLDLDVLQGDTWPRAVYPRWDEWLAIYRRFNHGTFDGAVTDRLGISVRPR